MIELILSSPIMQGDQSVAILKIDEDAITAKVIRESRKESQNLNHSLDESIDHLVCKIANLANHELDSLKARDYLKLRDKISDFLGS